MGTHPLVKTFRKWDIHPIDQNSVTWPHQTAKEAGKCSPAMNPGEERPGLEQLL